VRARCFPSNCQTTFLSEGSSPKAAAEGKGDGKGDSKNESKKPAAPQLCQGCTRSKRKAKKDCLSCQVCARLRVPVLSLR
jgi:hypothetical protein